MLEILTFILIAALAARSLQQELQTTPLIALLALTAPVKLFSVLGGAMVPIDAVAIGLWVGMALRLYASRSQGSTQDTQRTAVVQRIGTKGSMAIVVAMLVVGAVAAMVRIDPLVALPAWKAAVVVPLLVAITVPFWNTSRLPQSIAATTIVLGVIAVMQFMFPSLQTAPWNGIDEPFRATGLLQHPNYLAMLVVPLTAFLVSHVSRLRYIQKNEIWMILGALMGICTVLLTKSGGAVIALVGAVLIVIMVRSSWRQRTRILLACGIGVVLFLVVPVTRSMLEETLLLRENSGVIRKEIWGIAVNEIASNPITGVGLGGFREAFAHQRPLSHTQLQPYPHNLVLAFWLETTIAGLIIATWAVVRAIRTILRHRYDDHALELLAALVAVLIHGLVDTPYFHPSLAALFWILILLAYNISTPQESAKS